MPNQSQKKPNILVIFGDDIGWSNISAYNQWLVTLQTFRSLNEH